VNLKELKKNWEGLGKTDPMWAILTDPKYKGNKWDKESFFNSGKQEIKNHIQFIETELGYFPIKTKALDFGCGIGRCTNALAEYFDMVYGVDIASSMIEKARQITQFPKKTSFHQNSKSELSGFGYETFSFVFSTIALQHINPQYSKQYIAEFLKLLKPKGFLLFQTHTSFPKGILPKLKRLLPQNIRNFIYKTINRDEFVMELHNISKIEIENILRKGNGNIVYQRDEILQNGYTTSWFYVEKTNE